MKATFPLTSTMRHLGFNSRQADLIGFAVWVLGSGFSFWLADHLNQGTAVFILFGIIAVLVLIAVPFTAADTRDIKQSASAQTDDDDDQHLGIGS